MYLKLNNRLLASNITESHQVFKGERGNYFNKYYPSYIEVLINENPTFTKTFDNISLYSEVYNALGINLPNDTIDQIQFRNDYQNTGLVLLNVYNNTLYSNNTNIIKRKNRRWELQVPRDTNLSSYTSLKSRIRDNYSLVKLQFNNSSNKKFILQDILTTYRIN